MNPNPLNTFDDLLKHLSKSDEDAPIDPGADADLKISDLIFKVGNSAQRLQKLLDLEAPQPIIDNETHLLKKRLVALNLNRNRMIFVEYVKSSDMGKMMKLFLKVNSQNPRKISEMIWDNRVPICVEIFKKISKEEGREEWKDEEEEGKE